MPPISANERSSLSSVGGGAQKSYGSNENMNGYKDEGHTIKHRFGTKDKYNLAYLSFFLIGIGMLLPWNFFINADQYFKDKLKNNENDQKLFESAFSICSQIPCGVALVINLYLTNRVSRNGRVIVTLVISTAVSYTHLTLPTICSV